MAIENFTTYTEYDNNDKLTVTSSQISIVDAKREDEFRVSSDKGADYFDGDFAHSIDVRIDSCPAAWVAVAWMVSNYVEDVTYHEANLRSYLALVESRFAAGTYRLQLKERYGGSVTYSDYSSDIAYGDSVYLTIIRDESVGTYGTLYCYVYSDSGKTNLLDTLSITLHLKSDFRYIYGINSRTSGTSDGLNGTISNLDLSVSIATPSVTTQAVTDIVSTTATGNGNVTDLGETSVTQHGHCWNTTGTPTTATDDKTENGAKVATGAFTSSLTGLTVGTPYFVRAYATNTGGTSYGGEVNFTAGAVGGELRGNYAVVEDRFHYVDAYGVERYIKGTVVP